MEPMLETIDLDVEEPNELLFKVKVEGAEQAPAKVRLVCESGDFAFMFNGHTAGQDGLIQFVLPPMKDKLKEGLYAARVEVLIDNRYFAPVQFQVNFKKTIKVVAEQVTLAPRKSPEITVTAAPVIKKPAPVVEREAPPPARHSAQITLQERYHVKNKLTTVSEDPDEDAILAAAKSFVNSRRKK